MIDVNTKKILCENVKEDVMNCSCHLKAAVLVGKGKFSPYFTYNTWHVLLYGICEDICDLIFHYCAWAEGG